MGTRLRTIGFDADDTLWHNERFFRTTEAHFAELLADHAEKAHLTERLLDAEKRNLGHYGFGIKGFTLSMIETAATYARVFAGDTANAMMIGNSLKSDVLPALEVGSWGVYVPHALTWTYEHADKPEANPRYRQMTDLSGLDPLVEEIEGTDH